MKESDILSLKEIDLEVSKLQTSKRQRIKSELITITFVSLLLSMSTAVSFVTVLIPLGITQINLGFTLKYFIIAISFQVVGIYWGMIIGLFDALLQFLLWGFSPLFRLTSGIGLAIWVLLFWLFFDKIFKIYQIDSKYKKNISLILSSILIFLIAPITSASLQIIVIIVEEHEVWKMYSFYAFIVSYISFMIFDLFAIILFTLSTTRIHLIMQKYKHHFIK